MTGCCTSCGRQFRVPSTRGSRLKDVISSCCGAKVIGPPHKPRGWNYDQWRVVNHDGNDWPSPELVDGKWKYPEPPTPEQARVLIATRLHELGWHEEPRADCPLCSDSDQSSGSGEGR